MFKRWKTYSIIIIMTFVLSIPVNAELLLEPYIGYSLDGDLEQDADGIEESIEGDHRGFTFGGRLGVQKMGLMLGLQYEHGISRELEVKQGGAEFEDDFTRKNWGAFLGYNFPVMFRAWGTYFFDAEIEGDEAVGGLLNSSTTFKGQGYGVGLGFTGLPLISINLEYRNFEYDEREDSGVESALSPDVEASEIMLSVSLPLTF